MIFRYIILPNNLNTNIIDKKALKTLELKVTNFSKAIKNIINNKNNSTHIKYDAGIYTIQCLDCNKK